MTKRDMLVTLEELKITGGTSVCTFSQSFYQDTSPFANHTHFFQILCYEQRITSDPRELTCTSSFFADLLPSSATTFPKYHDRWTLFSGDLSHIQHYLCLLIPSNISDYTRSRAGIINRTLTARQIAICGRTSLTLPSSVHHHTQLDNVLKSSVGLYLLALASFLHA